MPLIDAAAEVGCEFFCIDAGWYDETGSWWDSVGEWLPSKTRFPKGLGEVVDHIRSKGMVPGLWLEPEVVGVRSPMAQRLPDEAFFLRNGTRIVEHHTEAGGVALAVNPVRGPKGKLSAAFDRSIADIGALRLHDPTGRHRPVIAFLHFGFQQRLQITQVRLFLFHRFFGQARKLIAQRR